MQFKMVDLQLSVQHQGLFPVYRTGKGTQAVNLRDVHESLDVNKAFSTWAKAKLKEHRLTENKDFVIYDLEGSNSRRGRKRVDYVVPLAVAKKIAMGINTAAGDQVKDYFLRCEEIAVAVVAQQAEPLKLTDFTKPTVQVQCVKNVGKALYRPDNNPTDIIEHHRQVFRMLTGKRPSQYVKEAVKRGLRVASLSGRALLRRMEPAKACTAAFIDDARTRGKSLAQLDAAGVVQALPQAFDALLRAGYSMEELGA